MSFLFRNRPEEISCLRHYAIQTDVQDLPRVRCALLSLSILVHDLIHNSGKITAEVSIDRNKIRMTFYLICTMVNSPYCAVHIS